LRKNSSTAQEGTRCFHSRTQNRMYAVPAVELTTLVECWKKLTQESGFKTYSKFLLLSRYADIYTLQVSNFCWYSPFVYFQSQTQVRTHPFAMPSFTEYSFIYWCMLTVNPRNQILNQASVSICFVILGSPLLWCGFMCCEIQLVDDDDDSG
jgi:hypothetical protein